MTDLKYTLSANNLSCIRQQKILFSDLSLRLTSGDALLIEGANGSGKSSLLRLLTGLATPERGEIFWQHQKLETVRSDYLHHLHYIGHTNGIKLGLTVEENLFLAGYLSSAYNHFTPEKKACLEALQLSAHLNTPAMFLSAGQKRRLALAKLWLFPKTLWILDEPLTALDVATQTFFLAYLKTHLTQGGMAILSSHQSLPDIKTQHLRLASC